MKKVLSAVLFMLSVSVYVLVYGQTVGKELTDNVLRFHIIANSNSNQDQEIKLAVRDFVSQELTDTEISPKTAEYVEKAENLANEYLRENDVSYTAVAKKERVYIPKKSYKNITMPSGEYDAIRLSLGKAEGENWWCVAYPALCFSENFDGELSDDGTKKLSESISGEALSVIEGEREYRLFIVDLVGKMLNKR